jgi:PAS domain S-box-containing protein
MDSAGLCRSMLDLLPSGIMLLSSEGTVAHMNPAALASVEAGSLDQMRSKPFLTVIAPEFRSSFLALFRKICAGGTDSLEFQITGLRGTRRWLEAHAVPFPGTETGETMLLAVCRDITERVQREGRDRYFQKMDAIATLASGVAHDFNNILTSIVGYATILKLKLPSADPLRPFPLQILSVTDSASVLIRKLLAFGSKQLLTLTPVRVADLVHAAIETVAAEPGGAVPLAFRDSTPAGTLVMIDQPQMEQALHHVIQNARDAMPSGGNISITTELTELEDTFISIHGYGSRGSYAVIAVTDAGRGMDEATRRKAFEPFFTTKITGVRGLGLGLAIVYGTVKSHRGFVHIYSEPGTGTTVRIYLPVADRSATGTDSLPDLVPEGRGEVILLVEDDDHIRGIMRSVLEEFGYTVLPAASGEEALRVFRADPDRVALAMLDAVMPGLSGREVLAEIRKLRPVAYALFSSGYTTDLLQDKGLLEPGVPFVSKPVSPRDLLRKIREVLEP